MVFCNMIRYPKSNKKHKVTILILIDGFLQSDNYNDYVNCYNQVTILILIDGFLQSRGGLDE